MVQIFTYDKLYDKLYSMTNYILYLKMIWVEWVGPYLGQYMSKLEWWQLGIHRLESNKVGFWIVSGALTEVKPN